MKTCEYCGKEIDYNHAYCNEECENNTFQYHKKRKKFQTLFSVCNITGIIVIMLGGFIGVISQVIKIGLLVAGSGLSVLGLLNLLFPYYGIDEQIRKRGIVSTQRTVRFVGTVLLVLGIGFLIGGIIVPFG